MRLSGPGALAIATPLLRLRNPLAHSQARFAEIVDPEHPSAEGEPAPRLDEAVVTYFAGPNSYTGEDVVEVAAHGSPIILDLLVRQALAAGARLAKPGEFTERAFLSGRMDLTQAEAVRDLIEAQTLYQARVAAQQMGGALSRRVRPAKQALVDLIAVLEAGIEFAEDDIDLVGDADILSRIAGIGASLNEMAASFEHGRIVHSGLTLAIVGRPNVGKSSLFNRLVQRDRAIVTAMPGTTRDLVSEQVSLGGIPLELVDTAGLREATDEAESIGIQRSHEALADADMVLVVLAASLPIEVEDERLVASLAGRRVLVVMNKADLQMDETGRIKRFETAPVVWTSALTGEGVEELRAQILSMVRRPGTEMESGMLTTLRHAGAVRGAMDALTAAENAVRQRTPHEMLLLDLYGALRQLDELTGETTADDILNLIFSTFCIGK